jgi:hypothetical protein
MSDTIDHQLEHLAELHAEGVLNDDEFTAAKANALGPPAVSAASGIPAASDPILAAAAPNIPSKIVWFLLVVGAFIIGVTIMGLSSGLEWSPAQAPAAPIVCPGGRVIVGYDVSYSVATKGVDLASVCVKNGTTYAISDLWLSTVMTVEYTLVFLAIFVVWRLLYLRKDQGRESLATWSKTGVTGTGVDDA